MAQPTLGAFSWNFLASPAKLPTLEFFGVAFLIVAVTVYWSHFINDMG